MYLRGREERGTGPLAQLQAQASEMAQLQNVENIEAAGEVGCPIDARSYAVGAHILIDLGVKSMRLLTNHGSTRAALEGYGLRILDTVPTGKFKKTALRDRFVRSPTAVESRRSPMWRVPPPGSRPCSGRRAACPPQSGA